jgi:hypothetical protein
MNQNAILALLQGKKTYLAAAGLIGLALYQASQKDYPSAVQSLLGGLAAFGLRSALPTPPGPPAGPSPLPPQ